MSTTMLAVEVREPGGPEVLGLMRRPRPQPEPGQVLLRVIAAGVNRPDVMQRRGLYPPPPGASDILGLELSGEVVASGPGASRWAIGDRVCALVTGGAYAEFCVASESLCLPIPERVSLVEAAALPEAIFTVWTNVFDRGRLRAGERFLVHGGTSGIGVAAIQLARVFGADVYATAGSDEKCRYCERLGAKAINYRNEDFVERINTWTDGRGVDLILDMIAGDYLQRNLSCLAEHGRLVQIAVQNGPRGEINLLPIMLKRLTLTGSTLRGRKLEEKSALAAAVQEKVWPLLSSGRIKVVVYESFPLERVADAHRLLETSRHIGKIVLEVGAP
jgi:putative PIG3 family NAD(P)H quinone oxidoreductase